MTEAVTILSLFGMLADPNIYRAATMAIIGEVADIVGAFIFLIIGVLVIILIVGLAIVFLPAIIVAIVIWFLTGSFFLAGIAFLVIALISLISKI